MHGDLRRPPHFYGPHSSLFGLRADLFARRPTAAMSFRIHKKVKLKRTFLIPRSEATFSCFLSSVRTPNVRGLRGDRVMPVPAASSSLLSCSGRTTRLTPILCSIFFVQPALPSHFTCFTSFSIFPVLFFGIVNVVVVDRLCYRSIAMGVLQKIRFRNHTHFPRPLSSVW